MGQPLKLVAEFGQSHLGSLEKAKEQVLAAKAARWTHCKWQMFDPARLCGPTAVRYWDRRLGGSESQEATFRQNGDLKPEEWWELAAFCATEGLEFVCTPFDLEAVDFLEELGVTTYKIASADITYERLLARVAATRKAVILSTGASRIDEIISAVDFLDRSQLTLLACTLDYPTAQRDAQLSRMEALRKRFPWAQVGYSDHTTGVETGLAAAAMGADLLEKHCTVALHYAPWNAPDDQMALRPDQMRRYAELAQVGADLRGQGWLEPTPAEEAARAQARRSAHTTQLLTVGHRIEPEDVIWKRPAAGGLEETSRVIGRTLRVTVDAGTQLTEEQLF